MFIRPSTILFSVVALAGVATAAPSGGSSSCNTGAIQCCNNNYSSSSTYITELFGFLGIPMPAAGGLVALGCSPITGTGTGVGSACIQQPVCCTGNTFNGLINIGCSPITIVG